MSSRISQRQIAEAILSLLGAGQSPQRIAQSLAAYLIVERRSGELNGIINALSRLRYEQDGVLEITATSALPLSGHIKREAKKLFNASHVNLYEERDPEVMRGAIFSTLDQQLDLSLKTRLNRLKLHYTKDA